MDKHLFNKGKGKGKEKKIKIKKDIRNKNLKKTSVCVLPCSFLSRSIKIFKN